MFSQRKTVMRRGICKICGHTHLVGLIKKGNIYVCSLCSKVVKHIYSRNVYVVLVKKHE